jgi:hypothetical protein
VTTPDTLPPDATKAVGSAMSRYNLYQGIDPQTGDWYDLSTEFGALDIETMLANDGRARSVEQALTLPLRAAPFAMKPGQGDTGEYEQTAESLDRMSTPMPLVLGQAAQSLIYRITYLEKVFDVSRGQVDYQALAWRPPDSCSLRRSQKTGEITGFRQQVWGQPMPVQIDSAKAAIFLHGANRDPVRGSSEMQVSYRCFRDKQKLRALWLILAERTAAPWIIAKTSSGNEDTVAAQLAKLRAGGIFATSQLDAGPDNPTVLNVAGEVATIIENMLKYLDSEMAGSVLAGFLDLTGMASRGAGSLALSKDQTDFFTSSMDAAARELASTVRDQIVGPLVRLNKGPDAVVPSVTLGPISGATTEQTVALLQALAAAPSGTVVPSEFVDELTIRVAAEFNLDADKIRAAIKTAEEKSATSPAAAPSAPVHAAATVLTGAAERAAAREAA